MRNKVLLGLSAILASAATTPVASAQDVVNTQGGQVEEVIVTAQRREENLQRAAVSVDAVTASELTDAGVGTNPGDLNRLVPAAQIASNGSPYPAFYIRGVGNFTANSYTDSTVGVNYDGVPITRASSTVGMFYDLERIEVLKGPQGTLYGRNNTGGSVNILPAHPVLDETIGNLTFTAGDYNLFQGTGFANVPLGERVALRASANFIDRDGYYNNDMSNDVGRSARLQLLFEPTDSLSINLGIDYHHQGGTGAGLTALDTASLLTIGSDTFVLSSGQPLADTWDELNTQCDGVADGTAPFDTDDHYLLTCTDAHFDGDFYGVTATVDWTMPGATLTVVPSVRWADLDFLSNGKPDISDVQDSTTSSLEVRLASDSTGRFGWIVGAYGLDESIDSDFHVTYSFVNVVQTISMQNKSAALFATARYALTDSFRASVGARYTHDDKSFEGSDIIMNPIPGVPPTVISVDENKTWDEPTYRAGLEYDVTPDSMIFVSYDTGYKAGGFFFAADPAIGKSYDPETVTAYTIGSRNLFFDSRWLLNIDLFDYKYKDQQVSQFAFDTVAFQPVFPTKNFGEVNLRGVEIDTQFYATPTTRLHADLQFMDSEMKQFYIPDPRVAVPDAADRDAPNAPDFTASFGIEQTFKLGSAGSLVADLSGQYRSEMLAGTDFTPWQYVDAVTTGDFSLKYEAEGGRWSIAGFVNNFTDEDVPVFVGGTGVVGHGFIPPATPPNPPSLNRAAYRAPRTLGLRLAVNF